MEAETEQAADAAATIPGVDSVAVTLYRWTVVHGRLTPATLAQAAAETGIGEPDCRRALAALTEACLLQAVPAAVPAVVPDDGRSAGPGPAGSEPVGWQPVSPQAATAQLLSDRDTALRAQEEALRAQRRRIQQERDGLAALVPVYLQARQHAFPQGTIDHLPDKFAVRALLCDVIDSCRSEVLVSKHGGSFPPAALREALPRDLALLGRGIRMRSLYQHATRFDQPTRMHAEQLIGAGAEVRTLPEVLPQMIIVDGALALLPARSGGALVIREPDLLAYLLDVFARDWENATPFATGPQAAHDIAVTVKQSILVLLAKGLKDESIARRLGISLRTCRRHVSEILEGLGAHSRFQAGVFAERRGLTAHPAPAPKPSPDAPAPTCASEPACASESADPAVEARCPACGASLAQQQRPNGRPPTYCSSRCRSRAYRARGRDRAPESVTKPADAVT
ncbi:helix-turn-helix transcriptional regulator [Kitasatospora purpeofusca]|uniref:helix-turn-helix transcriptional regulator n=1 Tax=Kitasatospora purpeofusca TaxID=67352 RepID=UPI002259FE7F|nr:LuxR C-terminal-related transcriptional regulator [Kitasatospora purpeofusca]MCX4752061.1 LuxR C-terminal-related transcriptional regulator [Kitasatospora purpeofusca]WSR31664.1 LuxR C-terminal-related transcriptional regulator [Kitasatospora purpeofusca]WSR39690.1 LuxR C-terminal-related transcriptional regulator [Kitasatospora purpeofusca]